MKIEEFTYGHTYHIFNRGINDCNLFTKELNYYYFMRLYSKYLAEVTDTYAWVLMPNHFHILLKVKEKKELRTREITTSRQKSKEQKAIISPSQQLSRLFNSYAQSFNKWNYRHGSLFERPFKRIKIDNESYLREALIYIHNNPVYHGFCKDGLSYKWSSYRTFFSSSPSKIDRATVISWFGDHENFVAVHKKKIDIKRIEKDLGI